MDGIPGFPPKFSEEKIEIGMKYEREVERRAPELLGELRGMAEGSSINYDVLATFELSPLRMRPSCTVMAIAGAHTRSGLPILARNHEGIEGDGDYLSLSHIGRREGLAVSGSPWNTGISYAVDNPGFRTGHAPSLHREEAAGYTVSEWIERATANPGSSLISLETILLPG